MTAKKRKREEIIGTPREVEIMLGQGGTTAEVCWRIAVCAQTYYRWRKEYGGLKTDQAPRMKGLEKREPAAAPCDLRGSRPSERLDFRSNRSALAQGLVCRR